MKPRHFVPVPLVSAKCPTKPKAKTHLELALAFGLPEARISGSHDYHPYCMWGLFNKSLTQTLCFLLPQNLSSNFMVTGNKSH